VSLTTSAAISSIAAANVGAYVWTRRQTLVGNGIFLSRGVVYYVVMLCAVLVMLSVVGLVLTV
jgi:hypothetical protein